MRETGLLIVRRGRPAHESLLAYAAATGRVRVTFNRADYQLLNEQWRLQGRRRSGTLWCAERSIPRRAIGDLVKALETCALHHDSPAGLCVPLARAP